VVPTSTGWLIQCPNSLGCGFPAAFISSGFRFWKVLQTVCQLRHMYRYFKQRHHCSLLQLGGQRARQGCKVLFGLRGSALVLSVFLQYPPERGCCGASRAAHKLSAPACPQSIYLDHCVPDGVFGIRYAIFFQALHAV